MAGRPDSLIDTLTPNRFAVNVLSGRGDARDVLCRLCALLRGSGCAPALVDDGIIALAEVLNNIEEHAYCGDVGRPMRVEVRISGHALDCTVDDWGAPLPAGGLPGADMPSVDLMAPDSWPEGGFGWAMVRRLTQELTYERAEGCNRLRFRVVAAVPVGIG